MFGEDLLATHGTVSTASSVGVAAHIAVRMPYVVPILLIEGVIGDLVEALPPEEQTFFEIQPPVP